MLVAVIMLVGFIVAYMSAAGESGKIDHKTSCRKDAPLEIIAIVIDHTDSISPVQKMAIETDLQDIANSSHKSGSIQFYSVSAAAQQVLKPDFTLCNPGNSEQESSISGNKARAAKKFAEKFENIIQANLGKMLTSETAHSSPIMESIQSVAVTSFLGKRNAHANKRLVLVSDLLQHTPEFSLFKGIPDFSQFQESDQWRSVRADLKNVDVDIFFIHRNGGHQDPKIKTFWQMYFFQQGAKEVRFHLVPGK